MNELYAYFATPAADERVAVVSISEATVSASPPFRYAVEGETINVNGIRRTALYVADAQTGDKIRLGDDAGAAILGTMNDNYVVWSFLCDPCNATANGLYVHILESGENILITEKFMSTIGSTKLADSWVAYMYPEKPQMWAAQLYASNFKTGQTVMVSDDALYANFHSSEYFAVNEAMVAWIGVGQSMQDRIIKVYDLLAGTLRLLEVTVKNPTNISVSQNAVVWWDGFWKGYDLKHEAVFTIPVLPPGWENVGVQQIGPVTAKGSQLYWSLKVNNQDYYFTAPVMPAEEKTGAVSPLPTPIGAPTRIPLGIQAVPTALPPAYP